MQNLIASQSFSGEGLICITDTNGTVVISPTNLDPFMQLDDIFSTKKEAAVVKKIQQMQQNMQEHRHGVLEFTALDGLRLMLSYYPLENYDWVLLTLVPANFISHKTDQYITRTFCITAGIILAFILILIVFVKIYRGHYRQLHNAAFVDRVTDGMNNAAFQLRCEKLLRQAPPNTYAVALLNIKSFKLINETYGSQDGDDTLRYVMRVLRGSVGEDEAAARADADNFFLCLRESDPAVIKRRLRKMIHTINGFRQNPNEPYTIIIQSGVYIVSDPSLEITVIQDRAKTACQNRRADEEGRCLFYDSAITEQLHKERELSDLFASSLANRDFQVYLQPKILTQSEAIGGAEALVRWFHPQKGMIYPSDFIPLFEKNGKVRQLDLFVFEEVCRTLRRWMDEGADLFPISVNLSRQHFKQPGFLSQLADIAAHYQVPCHWIELELTESIFFDDQSIEAVKEQIDEMHRIGFLCSLDDFGAGYSSLGLLMEFEVDTIKLDRRFFLNIDRLKTQELVSSIIGLAKKIGAHTVAEGIETSQQLEFLRHVNCDMIQGYVYSKPLCITDFERWRSERKPKK